MLFGLFGPDGPLGTAPAPESATAQLFHKTISGVLVALVAGVSGMFAKLTLDHTRLRATVEQRDQEIERRLRATEAAVAQMPELMDRVAERFQAGMADLRESFDRQAEATHQELRALGENVAYIKGRTGAPSTSHPPHQD